MDRAAYFLQLCLEKQPFLSLSKLESSYVIAQRYPTLYFLFFFYHRSAFARTVSTVNVSLFSKQISASIPAARRPFDQASILSLD